MVNQNVQSLVSHVKCYKIRAGQMPPNTWVLKQKGNYHMSIIMFRARGPRVPSQVCGPCNCHVSCRKTYVCRYNVPVT